MDEDKKYQQEPLPVHAECNGRQYSGLARPIPESCRDGICHSLDVFLDHNIKGTIFCREDHVWKSDDIEDGKLVACIGECVLNWYHHGEGSKT
jgi:hypothetical protein